MQTKTCYNKSYCAKTIKLHQDLSKMASTTANKTKGQGFERHLDTFFQLEIA